MKSRIILHSFESMSFELIVAATDGKSHPSGGNRGPAFAIGDTPLPPLPPPPTVPGWIITSGMLQLPGGSHTGSMRQSVPDLVVAARRT